MILNQLYYCLNFDQSKLFAQSVCHVCVANENRDLYDLIVAIISKVTIYSALAVCIYTALVTHQYVMQIWMEKA